MAWEWFRRRPSDDDIGDELDAHVRLAAQAHPEEEPAQAPAEARRDLGNLTRVREDMREVWVWNVADEWWRDLRHAVRSVRRRPSFALTVVVTLALAMGAATAVFSVVFGVLLRPLPFPNADRLVQVVQVLPPAGDAQASGVLREPARSGLTGDQFRLWRTRNQSVVDLALYRPSALTLVGDSGASRLNGMAVSPSVFPALGVRPYLGRTFLADEEQPGQTPVVVLSYSTWSVRFGGDPAVVGSNIPLGSRPHVVVGVMPQGFAFPPVAGFLARSPAGHLDDAPAYWVPFPLQPPTPAGDGFTLWSALGRLVEGVSLEQARAEAAGTMPPLPNGERPAVELVGVTAEMTRRVRPTLWLFLGGVLFVVLIACVNVTNLLLAEAVARRHEFAIRMALGAGKWRVARQIVGETGLLAFAAGVAACVLGSGAISLMGALPPDTLPRLSDVRVDGWVVAFTLVLAAVSGLGISGLAALRVLWTRDPWRWLGAKGVSGRHRRHTWGKPSVVLVVAEVALTMSLLVGGGLLMHSLLRLVRVDPGFKPDRLLTFRVSLPPDRYPDGPSREAFWDQLRDRLQRLPDVESAALSSSPPLQLLAIMGGLRIDDVQASPPAVAVRWISPGYFQTIRTPLLVGREPQRGFGSGGVVVNEAFARQYFGSASPLEHDLQFGESVLDIVGLVADNRLRLDSEAVPEVYMYAATPNVSGVVRTRGDPYASVAAVRQAVGGIDSTLGLYSMDSMDQIAADSISRARLYGGTAATLGVVALLLAGMGIYGLLAYDVSLRAPEFGVRMALGADSIDVVRPVLGEGLKLAGLGVGIGLAGATLLTRSLSGLLFGLTPLDVPTYAVTAAILAAVAMVASYLPARRATHVSPLVALRYE